MNIGRDRRRSGGFWEAVLSPPPPPPPFREGGVPLPPEYRVEREHVAEEVLPSEVSAASREQVRPETAPRTFGRSQAPPGVRASPARATARTVPAPRTVQARPGDRPVRRGPSSRTLLRRALSSPGAARQGFLLLEVLGPPVSLRPDSHDRPS